jgi:hypothetical protein
MALMRVRKSRFAHIAVIAFCSSSMALALMACTALATSPVVEGQSFSNVGSSSATLSAQINAGGSLTSYQFEYGTTESYGSTTPSTSLGASSESVRALAQVDELKPETVYHFRIIATNANGESVTGADSVLTTLPAGVLGLPDGRGYEMVSPSVNADGNVYEPTLNFLGNSNGGDGDRTELPFQAASNGGAVAYVGDPSATGGTGSEGSGAGNEYLATRASSGGWTAANIEPSSGELFEEPVYEAFSEDLSVDLLDWNGRMPLTAEAPGDRYHILYLHSESDGSLKPLFTTKPPHRTAKEFGSYEVFRPNAEGSLVYAGSSSDFTHMLFEANDALTPDAVDGGREENNLYESLGGRLRLVNILPDGTTEPNASFGAPWLGGEGTRNPPGFSHVISADGTRIFWTDMNTNDLYVRENGTTTIEVDATQGGSGSSGGGRFWTADSSGSKVFFTDESRLTSESTAAPGAPDLYEYDLEGGGLTDLTVDANPGEDADVRGVVGASENGSYIYFVAAGALAPGAAPQSCEPENASAGCNLYLLRLGENPKFITTLSVEDNREGGGGGGGVYGDWEIGFGHRTAEVTSDGQHLVFMSQRSLTGYESDGRREVYVYDAADGGRLVCASCSPSGEPPRAGAQLATSYSNTYAQRSISVDGARVFFDSGEPLVPQDTNGQIDVYEWEQNGTGSCRLAQGCIYLLSGGTNVERSFFVDASANGDDVFIVTRAQLARSDGNENFDLYDARVGAPQPPSSPACTGSGCQGVPPAPPIFATPSSVTFNGVGNFPSPSGSGVRPKAKALTRAQRLAKALKTCRERKSRRGECKARARKRYGPKSRSKPAKGRK